MEIWKDIPGYEGYYQVSSNGLVKSLDRVIVENNTGNKIIKKGKLLKHSIMKGYMRHGLSFKSKLKTIMTHRLVAMAFIPNPDNKKEVNHIDGNKLNNCVENLEWVTPKENTRHAWDNKLNRPHLGESHGGAKLKNDDVISIRNSSLSSKELAAIYNVNPSTINRAKNKSYWSHI